MDGKRGRLLNCSFARSRNLHYLLNPAVIPASSSVKKMDGNPRV
jgi:hypothetical protein